MEKASFDPVFAVAGILDYLGIAKDLYGRVELNPEYILITFSRIVLKT